MEDIETYIENVEQDINWLRKHGSHGSANVLEEHLEKIKGEMENEL